MTSSMGCTWSPRSLNFWDDKLYGGTIWTASSATLVTHQPTNSPTAFYQLGKQKKLDIKKTAPREKGMGGEHIPLQCE